LQAENDSIIINQFINHLIFKKAMLKYSLQENLLTERPDDYSAQTIVEGSYGAAT
jgi:hypothetical protein